MGHMRVPTVYEESIREGILSMKKRLRTLVAALVVGIQLIIPSAAIGGQFTDVPSGHPLSVSIHLAVKSGLMAGYNYKTFGPDDPVTRAQLVQILFNRYGVSASPDAGFSDVAQDAWYAKAVGWAKRCGVVGGFPDGTFRPEQPITREQLIVTLFNLAKRPGGTELTALAEFPDGTSGSDYATEALCWAAAQGIIDEVAKETLAPRQIITRAQAASIVVHFVRAFVGKELASDLLTEEEVVVPDGATPAAQVNSRQDVKKKDNYPTKGAADKANANGYNTEANVDIAGSELSYEALAYLNRFLARNGLQEARWVSLDECEEYTLARAKELVTTFAHERPGGKSILAAENAGVGFSSASAVVDAWERSPGHYALLKASSGHEVCIARHGYTWVLTAWAEQKLVDIARFSAANYYVD